MSQLGRPNQFYRPDDSGARNRSEHLRLVVNPKAGAGSAARRFDELQRAAERAFERWDIVRTEGPGHGRELAAEAVEEGADIVAAVGGDGTCHEVVNGLVPGEQPLSRKVAFTTIPLGTGSDLARSLEMPGRLESALWIAATGITLPTDLGQARWTEGDETRSEVFVNSAGFGANGEVVQEANRASKALGGRASYLLATLKTVRRFRRLPLQLRWGTSADADDIETWEGDILAGFVANGSHCGGGMRLAELGCMHDGLLEVVLVPPLERPGQLRHLPLLYSGQVDRIPGARRIRTPWLEVRTSRGASGPVELDGELPAKLPCELRALGRRLHIRGGWKRNPLVAAGTT